MKRLTEEMVIARTKISDLSKVKKLNCWGSELSDIGLVRRMPNVEVLSLSVNKISNLSDFEQCRHLQELYVRQNDIRDLSQVCYLQNLPNLKHLWLSENPCANADGYRLAVIRALPQLQKLDNIAIHLEELSEALKKGKILTHPEDEQESEPEPSSQYNQSQYNQPAYRNNQTSYQEHYYQSPDRSPPRHEPIYEPDDPGDYYHEEDSRESESPPRQSPPRRQPEIQRSYSPEPETPHVYYEDRRNANSFDQDSPKHQQYYDRSPIKDDIEDPRQIIQSDSPKDLRELKMPISFSANSVKRSPIKDDIEDTRQTIQSDSPKDLRELKIPISFSANSIKEYTNGDRHYHQSVQYKHEGGSDSSNHSHSGAYESSRLRERERCDKSICPANHRPPFNRRPVTRNSSILSAVLCLVKELDYASLEVVEMAVRCRMDELDE